MKKRYYPLFLLIIFIYSACDPKPKQSTAQEEGEDPTEVFSALKQDFIDSLWKENPTWASYEGFHKYDHLLLIPNEEERIQSLKFSKDWLNKLAEIDQESLSENDLIDYLMMRDYLESIDFNLNEFKSYEWNPASYNLGGAFYQVLNYRKADLSERLLNLDQKMDHVEAYYQAAMNNINKPTKVHTQLAIDQLKGSIGVFEGNMMDSLKVSKLDATFKENFEAKVKASVGAINGYVDFLEEKVLANLDSTNSRSFRIGKELFEKKFRYDIQSAYTAKEIFRAAVEEKNKLHDKMYDLSEMLWENYYPEEEKPGKRLDLIKAVIEKVSEKHVHRDSFITAIRQQIPQLEEFVVANDLLELDPDKPLVVRETPKYMQGVAGASISAPGPYDSDAETYYNVTPLDHYTVAEAESYLKEYNHYVLQILNIHEAIPGHYTQLVYSNQSPSLIKTILGNGAMIEGWAVYSELMMLESGYGGDDLEMGLMYYKWNLRTVCNTILDYGVHVNNFSEEDAMHLLVREAFQEEAEAKGKWRRARLSQVQLCSYFTGFYEIRALREKIRELDGEDFNLKDFHEEFLSYGSAPVIYISRMMLQSRESNKTKVNA